MLTKLKKFYKQIKNGKPGARFIEFYKDRHPEIKNSSFKKITYPLLGIGLIVAGILLSIPPGVPGFLVVILGLGIFSLESRNLARFLDWSELKARGLIGVLLGL